MMKRLGLLFLATVIMSISGLAQTVNAPSATTYVQNTANQSATGFSVAGFNSSATLLVTVGLVNPPSGVSLRLTNTSGVTASLGYSITSSFTRISFTGTQAAVNTELSSLIVNTGSVPGNIYIAVTATENPTGYFYLPTNGHFYRPMSWPSGVSGGDPAYLTIKSNASATSFKGQTGYLVTITSNDEQNFIQANVPASNILIALTDRLQEGVWRWDAGPENGTIIKTANSGGEIAGQYNNWCGGEPNNWGTGENYTVTKWSGGNCWNDYGPAASLFPGSIGGYVIEYGTWSDPADQTFTDFYTGFVTHQIACSPATSPVAPTGVSSSRLNAGTVTLSATTVAGTTVDWYANSTGGNALPGGVGTLTYTTPSLTATTTYYVQARNTTTGCVSQTRTPVTATVNYPTPFTYSGRIYDVAGAGVSNAAVKLYTKLKNQSTYSLAQVYSTGPDGVFTITTALDISAYDFQVVIDGGSIAQPNASDIAFFNTKLLNQNFNGVDWYRMNTNSNSNLTISDIYLMHKKLNGAAWPNQTPESRLFTHAEWSAISSANSNQTSVYPGSQTITLTNPLAGGSSTFYLIKTGKIN